jgi:hypothetical protein
MVDGHLRFIHPVPVLAFAVACTCVWPRVAEAQIHWDASAQAGVSKHVLADRPAGGGDTTFGPSSQIAAHVALLPLVRLGGYVGYDIAPSSDRGSRDIFAFGSRVKVVSPWPRGAVRTWLFFGFGYAGVYARSEETRAVSGSGPVSATPDRASGTIDGAGGRYFEVPFGVGASYKLRKPWEFSAELGARAAFAHLGSVYEPGPTVRSPGQPTTLAASAGRESVAIGLTLGVIVDL